MFSRVTYHNIQAWKSEISDLSSRGYPRLALAVYHRGHEGTNIYTNKHSFLAILKACAKLKDVDTGVQVHIELSRTGLLGKDVSIGTALLDMYGKCGLLDRARHILLSEPQVRDAGSWNALISGYADYGYEEALHCFEQMQLHDVRPDEITYVCVLKICSRVGDLEKGKQLHDQIQRKGLLKANILVGNVLLDMYARNGNLAEAEEVFQQLSIPDVVSWTTLIAGYTEHGYTDKAVKCLEHMQLECVFPNSMTYVWSLKACRINQAVTKGQQMYQQILSLNLSIENQFLGSALVDMYCKFGLIERAQDVFHKFPYHNVVMWTSLIAGYAENDHGEEALYFFEKMQHKGISPNAVTLLCCLKACVSVGAIAKGMELHSEIERKGFLDNHLAIGTALVDMYGRCGSSAVAHHIFNKLPVRDCVSWNALITGYAQSGDSVRVLHAFECMAGEGIKPDVITFLIILNVCSLTGLQNKGQMYFECMTRSYGIAPMPEHHSSVVDHLVRVGDPKSALAVIQKATLYQSSAAWRTILSACGKCGNAELGLLVFSKLVSFDA